MDGSRESDNFSALKESGGECTVAIYNESEKTATSVADDIYYKVSVRGGTEHRSSSPWKLVLFVGASVRRLQCCVLRPPRNTEQFNKQVVAAIPWYKIHRVSSITMHSPLVIMPNEYFEPGWRRISPLLFLNLRSLFFPPSCHLSATITPLSLERISKDGLLLI